MDIANTPFEDLPSDWQAENLAAAKVVIGLIMSAVEKGRELNDEGFVEEASAFVYEEWLKRNGEWASDGLKKTF